MQSTRSHYDSGKALFDEGNFIDARDELELHVSTHAQDDEALHLLAMSCYRLKLYGEAIECFNKVIVRNPEVHTLQTNLGMAHLKNNQVEQAVKAFKRSLEINPDQPNTQRYLSLAETAIRMKSGGTPESIEISTEKPKSPSPKKAVKEAPPAKIEVAKPVAKPKAPEPPVPSTPAAVAVEMIKTAEEIEAEIDSWEPGDPTPVEKSPQIDEMPVLLAVGRSAKKTTATTKEADLESIEIPIDDMVVPDVSAKPSTAEKAPQEAAPEVPKEDQPPETDSLPPPPPPPPTAGVTGATAPRDLPTLAAHTRAVGLPEDREAIQWIEGNLIRLRLVKDRMTYARTSAIVSTQGDLKFEPIYKKWKGKKTSVLFGSASDPIMQITGVGDVLLNDEFKSVFRIEEEVLYAVEEAVSAFDGAVKFENGSLQTGGEDINLVQFKGRGVVALRGSAPLRSLAVKNGAPLLMDPHVIAGWYGKLMPSPKAVEISPGKTMNLLELRGDGQVLFRCRPSKNG